MSSLFRLVASQGGGRRIGSTPLSRLTLPGRFRSHLPICSIVSPQRKTVIGTVSSQWTNYNNTNDTRRFFSGATGIKNEEMTTKHRNIGISAHIDR